MADDISSMTGLPPGKKRHRGGHSGPGHKHLTDLIRAHKSKDYVAAKRHALDLGKALHGHSQGKMESAMAPPVVAPPDVPRGTSVPKPASGGSGYLAKALLARALPR